MWIWLANAALGGGVPPTYTGRTCNRPEDLADQAMADIGTDGSPPGLAGIVLVPAFLCCHGGGDAYLVEEVPATETVGQELRLFGVYSFNGDCTRVGRVIYDPPRPSNDAIDVRWARDSALRRDWVEPVPTSTCTASRAERMVEALLPSGSERPLLVVPAPTGWIVHQIRAHHGPPPYTAARTWLVDALCHASVADAGPDPIDPLAIVYAALW